MSMIESRRKVKKLVMAGMFAALAFASMFILRINVMFLTFDAKDTVVTIAGLLFGPLYSLAISLIVSVLEFFTVGDTGFWGFLMDFLSTAIFSCSCSLIYKYKKNMRGAVVGLTTAVITMTSFMLLFNLFIVPIYTPGYTTAAVAAMIPKLFLPFNLTKGVLNASLVLILYKPASAAMKIAGVTDGGMEKDVEKKNGSLAFPVTVTGLLIAALCVVVFFVFMDGNMSWINS